MRDEEFLSRAVARYHQLCEQPALAGSAVVNGFIEAQREAGLTFGGIVQCRSLRPAFLTSKRFELLREAVAQLWGAFKKIEQRALRDPSLAASLGLSARERELIAIDPGYEDATVVSRLDTYFADVPRVLEYNADSPAGMSYQAGQSALMQALPVLQRFSDEYELAPLRADGTLRETIRETWNQFAARKGIANAHSGRHSSPRVAILDLAQAATAAEFQIVAKDFNAHEMPTLIATPEDLRYDGSQLAVQGQPIDLVYKRLLVADFLEHYDLGHPLIRAYADGAVCIASSFRCTIAHKKKALSVLTDPGYSEWFSQEERLAIERFVPRTRDLRTNLSDAKSHQQELAIKPNDAHGGEDVHLGWECSKSEWDAALHWASRGDYVLQQRVEAVREVYPVFSSDHSESGAQLQNMVEDCNAYVFRGALGGVLTRLSQSSVVNVSKGGQAIPTFLIKAR